MTTINLLPPLFDLFGTIPVTQADIELWIDVVPRWPRDSPRRRYYAEHWNLPDKIRHAKASGLWPEIEKARTDQVRALLGDTAKISAF